jgi:hypothetical protein
VYVVKAGKCLVHYHLAEVIKVAPARVLMRREQLLPPFNVQRGALGSITMALEQKKCAKLEISQKELISPFISQQEQRNVTGSARETFLKCKARSLLIL